MQLINEKLHEYLYKGVYLDDILMFSETMEEHITKNGGWAVPKLRLTQLLAWSLDCQRAFERLKNLFAEEPIIQHPNPEWSFVIQAIASNVAVVVVLLQQNPQGQLQPCAYVSKKLINSKRW